MIIIYYVRNELFVNHVYCPDTGNVSMPFNFNSYEATFVSNAESSRMCLVFGTRSVKLQIRILC